MGKISPPPSGHVFLTNHDGLNNLGGGFLPSYIEIGPVVSDKKNFKVFHMDIEGRKPRPLAAMFFDKS